MRVSIPSIVMLLAPSTVARNGSRQVFGKSGKGGKGKSAKLDSFSGLTEILLDNECPIWNEALEEICTANKGILVSPYKSSDGLTFCCKKKLVKELDLEESTDCRAAPEGEDCLAILPVLGVAVGSGDDLQCCGQGDFFASVTPDTVVGEPDNSPGGEGPEEAVDGNVQTKFLTFDSDSRLEAEFDAPVEILVYSIASANDEPNRDPLNWVFEGSNDGTTWEVLDTQENIDFPNRFQFKAFEIANPAPFRYYALDAENNAGNIIQYAELALFVDEV